jgi:serine protease inhibitor
MILKEMMEMFSMTHKLLRSIVAACTFIAAASFAAQPVQAYASLSDDGAYTLTENVFSQRAKGENLVFSPYSLQQMLVLINKNASGTDVRGELLPYTAGNRRMLTEELASTDSGSLILLDKSMAAFHEGKANQDVRVVSYPGEALQAKLDFQKEILGSVIDEAAPQGHLTFLTAAHYFAKWRTPFDESLTQDRAFTTETGDTIQVPTMAKHFENGTGKITKDYSMTAISGEKGSQVYFICPNGNPEGIMKNMDSIIADFDQHEGTVRNVYFEVPKISLKNKIDLVPTLHALGFKSFFDGSLYFNAITGDIPYTLDSATQTATLDVNENYAEGKALTEVNFRLTALVPVDEVHNIIMNKPYFIVIKDKNKTGTTDRIVFMAWVANPKA